MTQKEKELLIRSLCEMLPYGVIINSKEYNEAHYRKHYLLRLISIKVRLESVVCVEVDDYPDPKCHKFKIADCKPYLRPMSSMTEDEKVEYDIIKCSICPDEADDYAGLVDWLNSHYFDYRGLIGKGLALEAPEGMYGN